MITLHESNITSFPLDNGIGVLRDAIRAYAEEELNGMFEFYMEYDSEGAFVDELKEERIIKAKAQDKLGYQLFRIYSITKNHENDNIIVHAQHITYDLANNFVEELKAHKLTKKQVMEKIGNSTVESHPFNMTSSNTTTVSSTNLYRTNPLQMVAGMEGSVLQIWGGQLERDNFNFILHDRRGHDDGVTVTFEKNITGLTAEFDISGVITRIFPYVFIEETDDSPERLITVSSKYIDSPHINDYEKIYIEPIDYSNDERINTDGTDAQIRRQLTNIASKYFTETGNDKIKVDMEVQFEHLWETEEYKGLAVLELVGMGDTVTVEHSRLKVNATAIVNYIRYDCIAEKNEEVRLGSVKARLTDNVNKTLDVVEKVEQAQQTANQAIKTANGKNTIYYGPDEPMTGMQKGDLWFKVIDGQYHKTYRFDGIEWKLVIDMDSQEAKREAEQARDRADDAVNRANQATQQATDAINQAQTSFDLAQESLTLGQGLTSRMTDAEGNLTALNQTTQSLAGRLSDAEGNLTTLTATVSGLQTTVSDVQGNVSNLTQLSNAMQAQLKDVEGNVNTLTLTSQSMQSTIGLLQDNARTNLLKNSKGDNLDGWSAWSRSELRIVDGVIRVRKGGSPTSYGIITNQGLELEAGKTYTLSLDIAANFRTSVLDYVYILYNDGQGNQRIDNIMMTNAHADFKRYAIQFTPNRDCDDCSVLLGAYVKDVDYASEGFLLRKVQVEQGPEATLWTPSYLDLATQTQITQLSDAINLRVVKGDVINQINLDTSGVLIGGDKILLDGNVTVTGQFKVGNANIKSIDAGKVTVGDLVGHSLVGGKVIGGYIEQQSGSHRIEMSGGEIRSFRSNNLAMKWGGWAQEFYNTEGSLIGSLEPTLLLNRPDKRGLALTVQDDFLTIGHWRRGQRRPILRTQTLDGSRTYVTGPYEYGYTAHSELILGANSRIALPDSDDDVGTPFNQATLRLVHKREDASTANNSAYLYFGGYGDYTREQEFEIRANTGRTTSEQIAVFRRGHIRLNRTNTYIGDSSARINNWSNGLRLYASEAGSGIRLWHGGQMDVMSNGTIVHKFFSNGNKMGGSIEIDGTRYGMSPIDSPQVLIEYIEFDVELSRFGTRIVLDEKYRKAVSNYAVFPSNSNVQVLEKGHDYFVVKGDGTSDFRIIGERIDATGAFWGDMNVDEVDINVA